MRKMVILLVMLLVIGMVLPVMAVKPDNVPPADAFTEIWGAIEELRVQINTLTTNVGTQITALQNKDTNLQNQITDNQQSQVVFKHGPAENLDRISPPDGFDVSDCDIIVRPRESVSLVMRYDPGTGEQDYHAISFTYKGVDKTPSANEWEIFAMASYTPDGPGGTEVFDRPALYTVICSK